MAAFVWRILRGEWYGIVVDPLRQLRRRGLPGLSLAFLAAFGVIFFHDLAQHPTGARVVWLAGGVKADLPWWLALLRTPVSLYVPALDLPVWAGITQLFLAFALAELALGRVRTLTVAYATTLAGTLTVRVMIVAGPHWWGFGLPPEIGQVLDTGPSAAVVGLFTYIAVVRRAPIVFTFTGGSMVWESIAVPNLAGREHLIAVAVAIVLGLLHGHGCTWLPTWLLRSRFVRERERDNDLRRPTAALVPSLRVALHGRPSARRPLPNPKHDAARRPEGVSEENARSRTVSVTVEAMRRGQGAAPVPDERLYIRKEPAAEPVRRQDRGHTTEITANDLPSAGGCRVRTLRRCPSRR